MQKDDPDFLTKIHYTPYVIWDNYLPRRAEHRNISPAFLGPTVLNMAGKEGTYYTDYLYQLSKKTPLIPPESYWDDMHIAKSDLEPYRQMQYDILFGSRYAYSKQGIKNQIVNPNYKLGYDQPQIESMKLKTALNEVEVTGTNFFPTCKVFLNDNVLPTYYRNEKALTADLPEGVSLVPGKSKLEVRLVDDKKTTIARSTAVTYEP
ncbi:hypothetical protein D3C73_729220 [compost metagenome]